MNTTTPVFSVGKRIGWVLLCLVASAFSVVIWPAFLLLPALCGNAILRTKTHWVVLFGIAVFLSALWLFETWLVAACFAALAVLPTLSIYFMQKHRMSNGYTGAICAGLSLVILYCMICLPGVLSGEGAFTQIERIFAEAIDYSRRISVNTPGITAAVSETWDVYLDAFQDMVSSLVVPMLCAASCVLALANLLFFRLFSRRHQFRFAPMKPFCDWALPRSMTSGLVLLLVASIVMRFAGWAYAQGFSTTINVIFGFPLMVQGLATLDFLLKRVRNHSTVVRILAYVGVGVLFSFLQSVLMLLGCFEQIFHLRARLRQMQTKRPLPPM